MFDPTWDDGCSSCTAGADEISAGLIAHLHARDTTLRGRLPRAAGQDRALQGKRGWTLPLVLVVRQRLQLRLPRHARRVGGAGRVQLPRRRRARGTGHRTGIDGDQPLEHPGYSCFLRDGDASSTPTRRSPAAPSDRRRVRLPRPDRARPPGGVGGAQGPRRRPARSDAGLRGLTVRRLGAGRGRRGSGRGRRATRSSAASWLRRPSRSSDAGTGGCRRRPARLLRVQPSAARPEASAAA